MKKRILLLGTYFYPEPTGIGKYSGEMIDYLADQDYQCTVIVPYPYYPFWKVQEPYSRKSFWYRKEIKYSSNNKPIEIYRCPQYVPQKPTGLNRMMQDFSFCVSCFLKIFSMLFKRKYDFVIAVAPSFMVGLLAILYKKIKGAKVLYHIQDLQIDAARDLEMIKSKGILNALFKMEKFILKNADIVSSISPGMIKKIRKKINREILYLPNWVDTSLFYPLLDKATLKKQFGIDPVNKVILYSGAIGEKQGLETIIHIADKLKHISHLKFVIGGSGPYKEKLVKLRDELQLQNVIFLPLQPFEKLNCFLNMADLHLVLQKANASDLVMPSKLATILSVGGVAIITATKDSSLYDMISSHGVGLLIEPENQQALLTAIEKPDYAFPGISKNARGYAEQFLSIDKVFSTLPLHLQ